MCLYLMHVLSLAPSHPFSPFAASRPERTARVVRAARAEPIPPPNLRLYLTIDHSACQAVPFFRLRLWAVAESVSISIFSAILRTLSKLSVDRIVQFIDPIGSHVVQKKFRVRMDCPSLYYVWMNPVFFSEPCFASQPTVFLCSPLCLPLVSLSSGPHLQRPIPSYRTASEKSKNRVWHTVVH